MSSLEDYEFDEYVESFKTASARTKHALYAVTIACVLIATATWNIRPDGWARTRVERWGQSAAPATSPTKIIDGHYVERVVERMLILDVSAVGFSLDVNELGVVGGIALLMLTTLLWVTIAREHENLYLALFKVNSLCNEDKANERDKREGKANLLYHALAMGQILSRPPTLARWQRSIALTMLFPTLLFLMPAAVQIGVTWTNRISYTELLKRYPPDALPKAYFGWQIAIIILLAILGALCWLHLRACTLRWRHVFFAINPGWKRKSPRPMTEWLKVPLTDQPWQRARLLIKLEPIVKPEEWVSDTQTLVRKGYFLSKWRTRIALADELFRALRRKALSQAKDKKLPLVGLRHARLIDVRLTNGHIIGEAIAEAVWPQEVAVSSSQPELP